MNLTVSKCFHCVKCLLRKSECFRTRRNITNLYSVSHFGTLKSKSEWIEPVGKRTGILVYNSLTKEMISPKAMSYTWYICGPTVYDASHIGHASNYVRYDIIRRILTNFCDINVIYLMGITDIDDKIINKANFELSYACFKRSALDFALWKSSKPGEPFWSSPWGPGRPGWHIECSAMASFCHSYYASLFFWYYWLLISWCMIVLRRSIWQRVRKHSGGSDLMFPHHENELAQSCSFHDVGQWANYWMHTGHLHLQYDPEKMSKSLKNVIPTSDLLEKYSANQFRMFCMLTHYRNTIEFTDLKMEKAIKLDNKIGNFLQLSDAYVKGQLTGGFIPEAETMQKLEETDAKIQAFLKDDFNTHAAMSALFDLISNITIGLSQKDVECRSPGTVAAVQVYVKRVCKKLGFHKKGWKMSQDPDNMKLKEVLDNTVKFRWNVRQFALQNSIPGTESLSKKERKKLHSEFFSPLVTNCDELRSELSHCKILVKDHKTYSSWEFVNAGTMSDESQWEEPEEHLETSQQDDQNDKQSDDTSASQNTDTSPSEPSEKSPSSDERT
ncbi:probable cysteine--tRNA ligase, mitochondrial [Ruditapes philippinarum]|uniref:probable cysteine--tRNA ligase, mitochondrial n=1 Tax=Ruditapes philippinarum TaxID=129788 RepID=UPI00295AC983|nr:probable cysteine--tRNA ligase, mitochondrial [Ruditapes philippinarum]